MKNIFLISIAAFVFCGCSLEESQEPQKKQTAKERRKEATKNYENKFLLPEEKK
ncbi:hypothetical protein I7M65_08475 [Neisseria meningitidis]|nr:hypothetical protein [Neisseria meningitidis]